MAIENKKWDIVLSTKMKLELHDYPIKDIDSDEVFSSIFNKARPFTMTGKEAMFALYDAVRYIVRNDIPGDIVECGVWRGGSALLAALTLRELGVKRPIWLYDTFDGKTAPTEKDIDREGQSASAYIEEYGDAGKWCYADLNDVRNTFASYGFNNEDVHFVQGDVLQSLPETHPRNVSLLRLDTDWYASTKIELEILYPRLSQYGILIVDDYGYWAGSRAAVDEYFEKGPMPLLSRVTDQVRLAVKI